MGFTDWFKRVTGQSEPEPETTVSAAPTPDDILQALDRVEELAREAKVPAVVQTRVSRIATTIRQTLPRMQNLGLGSRQSYSVMATATDYLPEGLGGYLRLPRHWADSRPIEDGKTSLMLLIDQLDLLGATMDKIFDAVCRADAQALIVHGKFLEEKFGHNSDGGQLSLGKPAPTSPEPAPGPLDLG